MGIVTSYEMIVDGEEVGLRRDVEKWGHNLKEGLDKLGLDGQLIVLGPVRDDGWNFEAYMRLRVTDPSKAKEPDPTSELDAEQVVKNWEALKPVTFEAFFAAYLKTGLGRGAHDHRLALEKRFEHLREVYETATRRQAGLRITTM